MSEREFTSYTPEHNQSASERTEAPRIQEELATQLAQFGLEPNPENTTALRALYETR